MEVGGDDHGIHVFEAGGFGSPGQTITISYSASDPALVDLSEPYPNDLPDGRMRLWRRDAQRPEPLAE